MRAEVLLDCISQVTETPDKFTGLPRGARAVQIADGNTSKVPADLIAQGKANKEIAADLGIIVPSVHVTDNLQLAPREYAILLKGERVAHVLGKLIEFELVSVITGWDNGI